MTERIINDITNFIFVSDAPQKSDVIFLPGGSGASIAEQGAGLYAQGFASKIIPSGKFNLQKGKFMFSPQGVVDNANTYNDDYPTECDFFIDVLSKNGVPLSAIIPEKEATYTKENAFLSRDAADKRGLTVNKAMVVCKSFHARRCFMCYQTAFPEADILVIAVDVYGIDRNSWHTFDYGIERVMGELARCGSQFVAELKASSAFINIDKSGLNQ